MAYRRSVPSRGRSFRRAFRSRPRTHNVVRPQRWTPANFSLDFLNFEDVTPVPSGAGVNTVIVMATIPSLFRTDETHLAEHQRTLELGGIVFDWQLFWDWALTSNNSVTPGIPFQSVSTLVLATDRLDFDGNPVSITTDWFNTQNPISLANAQTVLDQDVEYPTRIHWRHSRVVSPSHVRALTDTSEFNTLRTSLPVVLAQGSANLRLRSRINDEQALVFHFASATPAGFANPSIASVSSHLHLNGTLYYRVP